MLEEFAILACACGAAVLVFLLARARLRAPGARRSRRDDGVASTGVDHHGDGDGNGGDGGD